MRKCCQVSCTQYGKIHFLHICESGGKTICIVIADTLTSVMSFPTSYMFTTMERRFSLTSSFDQFILLLLNSKKGTRHGARTYTMVLEHHR